MKKCPGISGQPGNYALLSAIMAVNYSIIFTRTIVRNVPAKNLNNCVKDGINSFFLLFPSVSRGLTNVYKLSTYLRSCEYFKWPETIKIP